VTPTPHDLFNEALQLASGFDQNFVDLARTLRQLQDQDADLFARVLAARNMRPRKAYYLIEIDRRLSGLAIPKARLAKIGWTKLQLVAKFLLPENYEHFLSLAEQHTVRQLKVILEGGVPAMVPMIATFMLSPDDFGRLSTALLKHGARKDGATIAGKEQALMKIVYAAMGGATP
jgi:hypothetical protein